MVNIVFGRRKGLDVQLVIRGKVFRVRTDILGLSVALALLVGCAFSNGACTSCFGHLSIPSFLGGSR